MDAAEVTNVIPMVSAADQAQHNERVKLIQMLEDHIVAVKSGELSGLIILSQSKMGFVRHMQNVMFQDAVSMLARSLYKVQQDWDKFTAR